MVRLSFLLTLAIVAMPSAALAFDMPDEFAPENGGSWLVDHLETVRRTHVSSSASFQLANANVWSRGLDESDEQLPVPVPLDKAMGARVRPFSDFNLLIGTELSRHEDTGRALRSEFNWQFSWSHASRDLEGVSLGFGTSGSVESLHGGMSQSVNGSVGVRLISSDNWKARLRLSPRLSYGSQDHTWHPSVAPELISETVLSAATDPFLSLLNLRLGYDLAPDTRPSATARVELRFVPRP